VRRRYRQNADDALDARIAELKETGTKLIEAVVAGAS